MMERLTRASLWRSTRVLLRRKNRVEWTRRGAIIKANSERMDAVITVSTRVNPWRWERERGGWIFMDYQLKFATAVLTPGVTQTELTTPE
jgi:hypothetical protein